MFAVDRNHVQPLPRVSLANIDGVVSARLGTTRVAGNAQPAVFNRQIAMYLAKHVGGWSTTAIGRFYNGRDHSTVCYAVRRVEALRENDPEVDGLLAALAAEIRGVGAEQLIRTERPAADGNDLPFNEAFLDALADRLAVRILSRVPGTPAEAVAGHPAQDGSPARTQLYP
jgi:Bacterial dnaA protein helix-turn-helix